MDSPNFGQLANYRNNQAFMQLLQALQNGQYTIGQVANPNYVDPTIAMYTGEGSPTTPRYVDSLIGANGQPLSIPGVTIGGNPQSGYGATLGDPGSEGTVNVGLTLGPNGQVQPLQQNNVTWTGGEKGNTFGMEALTGLAILGTAGAAGAGAFGGLGAAGADAGAASAGTNLFAGDSAAYLTGMGDTAGAAAVTAGANAGADAAGTLGAVSSLPQGGYNPALTASSSSPAFTDVGANLATTGSPAGLSMLPATTDSTLSALAPDTAQLLGVAAPAASEIASLGAAVPSAEIPAAVDTGTNLFAADTIGSFSNVGGGALADASAASGGSTLDSALSLLKKLGISPAQAGLLGLSAFNSSRSPKMPGAYNTLQNNASTNIPMEQGIINSGGTSAPGYAAIAQNINSQFDQQLQQGIEALKQSSANAGMGGNNSAVLQQKIQQLTTQINTAREQALLQAQQQQVSQAIQLLTGNNQILAGIGATQLQQSEAAQAAAAQTAELALLLSSKSGIA